MKKHLYTTLVFLCISSALFAQKRRGQEKIKALKVAYLTEKLDLSVKEATVFWPLYNAYDKEAMHLRMAERMRLGKQLKVAGGIDALSEATAKTIAIESMQLKKLLLQITSGFYEKLPGILSYKKILKLQISELEFHRKLLKKLKRRGPH